VEGFESDICGDLNLGGHDIVKVSGERAKVFGGFREATTRDRGRLGGKWGC
jgi:hypothetical protein